MKYIYIYVNRENEVKGNESDELKENEKQKMKKSWHTMQSIRETMANKEH